MRVSLPMYPLDDRASHTYWCWLRDRLVSAGLGPAHALPLQLAAPDDYLAHWRQPDLLLSQTCGYPLVTLLQGQVQLVGVFHYHVAGCEHGDYHSDIVVRHDDSRQTLAQFRGTRVACNEPHSQSGYHALRAAIAPHADGTPFFSQLRLSGSHHASARLVAAGEADIAALDCVSAALLRQRDPATFSRLRLLQRTAPTPGLPLITSQRTSPAQLAALQGLLADSMQAPTLAAALAAMGILGFSRRQLADYQCIRQQAERHAGIVLAA